MKTTLRTIKFGAGITLELRSIFKVITNVTIFAADKLSNLTPNIVVETQAFGERFTFKCTLQQLSELSAA